MEVHSGLVAGRNCGGVLVIDDDADIRDALCDVLKDEGYSVRGACNGLEALDMLREAPLPCVILLDLMMPVMNGWRFRVEQKQDPMLAAIPVVVVTASASSRADENDGEPIDSEAFIVKPFDLSKLKTLLNAVERHCTDKHAQTS